MSSLSLKLLVECDANSKSWPIPILKRYLLRWECSRRIRHSLDTKTPSILCAHGSVFQHRGEVGFAIRHRISPSFKDGMYSVTSAFTASSFLAAECDCKAGPECTKTASTGTSSSDSGKHICVHCLPVLYQLTILLMECLAEHTIVTFASCFCNFDESDLDKAAFRDSAGIHHHSHGSCRPWEGVSTKFTVRAVAGMAGCYTRTAKGASTSESGGTGASA